MVAYFYKIILSILSRSLLKANLCILFSTFSILQFIFIISLRDYSNCSSFLSDQFLFIKFISFFIMFIWNSRSFFFICSSSASFASNRYPMASIQLSACNFDCLRNLKSAWTIGKYFFKSSFIFFPISFTIFVDKFKLKVWNSVSNFKVLYSRSKSGMAKFSCLFSSRS